MKKILIFIFLASLFVGCSNTKSNIKKYDEMRPMLYNLSKKAQVALRDGYFKDGESEAIKYLRQKHLNIFKKFDESGYKIRVKEVAGYAVVLICEDGKAIYEDITCKPNEIENSRLKDNDSGECEVTMTVEKIKEECE